MAAPREDGVDPRVDPAAAAAAAARRRGRRPAAAISLTFEQCSVFLRKHGAERALLRASPAPRARRRARDHGAVRRGQDDARAAADPRADRPERARRGRRAPRRPRAHRGDVPAALRARRAAQPSLGVPDVRGARRVRGRALPGESARANARSLRGTFALSAERSLSDAARSSTSRTATARSAARAASDLLGDGPARVRVGARARSAAGRRDG